jgi:hypothetical protein
VCDVTTKKVDIGIGIKDPEAVQEPAPKAGSVPESDRITFEEFCLTCNVKVTDKAGLSVYLGSRTRERNSAGRWKELLSEWRSKLVI